MTERIFKLDWDSSFLGYNVGLINTEFIKNAVDMSEIIHNARNDGYKLCYFMFDSRDDELSQIAVNNKGVFADDKVTYSKSGINDDSFIDTPGVIQYSKEFGASQMHKLAIQSSHQSRFRLDENFDSNVCDRMYRIWMDKSLSGELADTVYVYSENGKVSGMITLYEKNNAGYIGLIGVDSEVRRRNIGGKLMQKTFYHYAGKRINTILVDTQLRNTQACNFYEKYGFVIKKITRIYHFWL